MSQFKNKFVYLLVLALVFVYCYIEAGGRGDLYIFISATGNLIHQKNIYTLKYYDGYNYFYSVLFALLLKPFYFLPYFWVKFCWLLLNVFLFFTLFKLLAKSTVLMALDAPKRKIFLGFVFLFSFRFFHENIHNSQISIVIFWCCIYGLYLIGRQQPVLGSAILALGINIKLLPIVLLPYLIYRGYFKAFFFTILFYVFSLFFPSLIIDHTYNITLLKSWLSLINPVQERHVLDVDERSFHGLSTLLSTLLVKEVPDLYALPLKRNIADLSLPALAKILLLVRLSLVALTLYFLKWKPFIKAKSNLHSFIETSYILLLIPLIFPHQQHYAFLFTVPAFAVILYYLLLNYNTIAVIQKRALIFFLSLIFLTANLKIIVGALNEYYEHFKILTYGALLLIPLLIWVLRQQDKKPKA